MVLGESSCKSIPADDSLLRTAGSTGAILSKQMVMMMMMVTMMMTMMMMIMMIMTNVCSHRPDDNMIIVIMEIATGIAIFVIFQLMSMN